MPEGEGADILPKPIQCMVSWIGVASGDYPHDCDRLCEDKIDAWLREGFQLGSAPDIGVVGAVVDERSSHEGTSGEPNLWVDIVHGTREKRLIEGHYLEA